MRIHRRSLSAAAIKGMLRDTDRIDCQGTHTEVETDQWLTRQLATWRTVPSLSLHLLDRAADNVA